jgi:CheY-like chemotaxis protein/nitrogen-specific signal transduction histidine kinase
MRRVKSVKAAAGKRREAARARRARRHADASFDATEAALAVLAHEIRTPLNGILALSDLISAADLPPREREWASLVKGAAEHLAQLSTLVVDGVRAQARGLVLRVEPFRLRALVEAVAGTLVARAATRELGTDIAIADDLPEFAAGDRARLRAALENLADNAVKFTDRGRIAFTVETRRAARGRHRIVFSFTDSGVGLTRAEIAKLFRPFAQASAAIARRHGGAGLGLVFVKRLAQAMNGTLTVTSKAGQGSTFRLTVVLEAGAMAAAAVANGHGVPAKSLRVLCAEDNPYARVVLNTILTELGHRVDFAGTGAGAVAAVENASFGAVLMDVTLPDIDGLEATRRIRALGGAAAQVPIIGISGRSEPSSIEAARNAGMNAFLAKPVSPAALLQALAETVSG